MPVGAPFVQRVRWVRVTTQPTTALIGRFDCFGHSFNGTVD